MAESAALTISGLAREAGLRPDTVLHPVVPPAEVTTTTVATLRPTPGGWWRSCRSAGIA